jgi:hypothetical protein
MRLSMVLIVIFSIISKEVLNANDVKSFSNALNVIVKEFYIKSNLTFDIFLIDEYSNFPKDVISNVLKSNPDISVQIRHKHLKGYIRLKRSTIIFLDSTKNSEKLNERIKMGNLAYMKFQHTIVVREHTKNISFGLEKLNFTQIKSDIVNYEIFIYKNSTSRSTLDLQMYERFTERNCKHGIFTKNQFILNNQSWISNNFALRKYDQFNKCPLTFVVVQMTQIGENEIGNILCGYGGGLFKELASKLNFTYTTTSKGEYEIACHYRDLRHVIKNFNFPCNKYEFFEVSEVLMYSIGEEYTSYEKFLLPFDSGTWICCGIFFVGAFLVIFIINRLERKVQEFVFGRRVKSPAFNVLVAFFGQSQNILPGRNFSRFLLMLFILFCLIIRTAYQGVQFDMMYTVSI